jgi:hypothetical protein
MGIDFETKLESWYHVSRDVCNSILHLSYMERSVLESNSIPKIFRL